jgi:alcohol dehydrogenase class IV
MLLPAVTAFSLPAAISRYADIARAMGGGPAGAEGRTLDATERGAGGVDGSAGDERAANALPGVLQALNARLRVPRLRDCPGIDADRFERSLPKMAADALASGSPQNNPVVPSAEQIMELYGHAW